MGIDVRKLQVLANGTATNYTDVDCSSLIPPTSIVGYFEFLVWIQNGSVRPNGSTANSLSQVQANETIVQEMETDTSQIIEYLVTSGGFFNIFVMGFIEEL